MQRPEDLATRVVFQINPSLFSIAEQLLVQRALGAKSEQPLTSSSKMMGQREKNANNAYIDDVGLLKQDGFNPINHVLSTPNRFFVLMPTTLVRDAVPKPFRRFISLTATEIVQVWFLLVGGDSLTGEQIARIDKIADDAALDCSGSQSGKVGTRRTSSRWIKRNAARRFEILPELARRTEGVLRPSARRSCIY